MTELSGISAHIKKFCQQVNHFMWDFHTFSTALGQLTGLLGVWSLPFISFSSTSIEIPQHRCGDMHILFLFLSATSTHCSILSILLFYAREQDTTFDVSPHSDLNAKSGMVG